MEKSSDIELRLLIEAIYLKYSYDFRDYSGASVKRRVAHAIALGVLGIGSGPAIFALFLASLQRRVCNQLQT
ncbi:hypothetical protein, partial [Klebsiella pneumoniae]|uniref:hypothetical protein n=1 Tax=Klebsiella pneumoniae TaxID=573 RepID=UPI00273201E2